MRVFRTLGLAALCAFTTAPAVGQVTLTGVVKARVSSATETLVPLTNIITFASLPGAMKQPITNRTKWDVLPWDIDPAGGYRMSGSGGNYTMLLSNPAHYMRPIVRTNLYSDGPGAIARDFAPVFDYALFDESSKDDKPAKAYYQTFVARGTSITQVGFKPIWEVNAGVDNGDRTIHVSILARGNGTPNTWKPIGPAGTVLPLSLNNIPVNGIGARNFPWSVGWNTGEVQTKSGETYAVCIKVAGEAATFQTFWGDDGNSKTRCYRAGVDDAAWADHDLWMAVSSDNDGLLIPYNKRVQKEFAPGAGFSSRWGQSYIARGRALAGVVLYAAGSTEQIPLSRQRATVRVHKGGPDGPLVGVEKIAIGNGEWTGDASWGVFGVAYAPGEVALEPGDTYTIDFETLENIETSRGYINIKHVPSGDQGGFSPYRKMAPDDYAEGTAWRDGAKQDFDLDMQIVEYEFPAENWDQRLAGDNLLANGDMQAGDLNKEDAAAGTPDSWTRFATDPGTTHWYAPDKTDPNNRLATVIGGCITGKTVDGGYVQAVSGLSRGENYKLTAQIRSTYALDDKHQAYVGIDPTGQIADAKAATIEWATLPTVNGLFVPYVSEAVRPATGTVSVWLRGRTTSTDNGKIVVVGDPYTFKVDFDNVELRRVETGVPVKQQ